MRSIAAFMLVVCAGLASTTPAMAGVDIPFSYTGAGGSILDNNLSPFFVDVNIPTDAIVTSLALDVTGLSHDFPDDLEIYLLHPTINSIKVLQDQGDGVDITGVNLTFLDSAAGPAPDESQLFSGTYRPKGLTEGVDGGLGEFVGVPGAGRWLLLVVDDSIGDTGSFTSFTLRGTYVPEPVTMSLLAIGALVTLRRKRR